MATRKRYVSPGYFAEFTRHRAGEGPEPEFVELELVEVPVAEPVVIEDTDKKGNVVESEIVGYRKGVRRVPEDIADEYTAVYEEHVSTHGEPEEVSE